MGKTDKQYAAVVLRNVNTGITGVQYAPVADALLSGGVTLEEVSLLSYQNAPSVLSALERFAALYDGVFLICDEVLLSAARDALSRVAKKSFPRECVLETERCLFGLLPAGEEGVRLAREHIVPAVNARRGRQFAHLVLRTVFAPPEAVLNAVTGARARANDSVVIHTSEEYGCQRIEVIYDQTTPKMVTDEVIRILASELKDYLYALEDISVAARVAEMLRLHRYRICTAESFTGGGVARQLVTVPGASKFLYEGVVAYDNGAKQERLGVSDQTLKFKGAVSSEAAYEMAAGLLKTGNCDIAVATTGIAGPSSDGTKKPVGLCYIAVGTQERVRVFEYHLKGDREAITETAIRLALFLVFKEINNAELPRKLFQD